MLGTARRATTMKSTKFAEGTIHRAPTFIILVKL